jgi:diguanylate cyclase (GGDEF)-like protein/PAS domain S-box-containing protein
VTSDEAVWGEEKILDALRGARSQPIVSGFPEGALVAFDADLRYLCAGGAGLAQVGLTSELMEGKTIFEVFSPEVAAALEGPYRRVLSGEEATVIIHVLEKTFIHRIAPFRDDDGAVVAGIGFTLDMTLDHVAQTDLRASESRLQVERRRLRDAELVGHSGSWEWDVESGVISWSDGLFALHGIGPTSFDGGYEQAASRVHPEDRVTVDEALEAARRGESAQFRYRVQRAGDGTTRWFDSRATGVFEDDKLVRLVGAVADVTEKVSAEAEVIETNNFLQAVLMASPDYTFITDVRTGVSTFGSRDLLGFPRGYAETLGAGAIDALVHPDDQAELRALNAEARGLSDGEVRTIRYRLRHSDGQWRWFSRHVVPFRRDQSGRVSEVLGVLRDIDDVVRAEEHLTHNSLHDALTGLPNRALLLDRLEAALARCAREDREVAVLYCDLDGFKNVNDTAGHAAGDAVLVEVATRFRRALRDGDTVARVGGDEFVVVVEPWNRSMVKPARHRVASPSDERSFSKEVARRIVQAIAEPFRVAEREFEITVSVGVTHLRHSSLSVGQSVVRAIQQADEAMYVAKREGKNRVHISDKEPANAP